jgi:hypothetical protein
MTLRRIRRCAYAFSLALLVASSAGATSVPSLTFEELTDHSELIVSGQVTRSWADWDNEHKFIWTHYELSVDGTMKGSSKSTVVLSEPGGTVGLQSMNIAGAVGYQTGDHVLVFLQRMPNGYLRTTGWSQGKYTMDNSRTLHADVSSKGLEIVSGQKALVAATSTSLRTLDGMPVTELGRRVGARLQTQRKAN